MLFGAIGRQLRADHRQHAVIAPAGGRAVDIVVPASTADAGQNKPPLARGPPVEDRLGSVPGHAYLLPTGRRALVAALGLARRASAASCSRARSSGLALPRTSASSPSSNAVASAERSASRASLASRMTLAPNAPSAAKGPFASSRKRWRRSGGMGVTKGREGRAICGESEAHNFNS